jgi:purine-nucleoside phosphorylase
MLILYHKVWYNASMKVYEKLQLQTSFIKSKIGGFVPQIAIVLGSGLAGIFGEGDVEVAFADIPHFPKVSVKGHKGKILFKQISGVPIMIMEGRFHYYEGYSLSDVVAPVRIAAMLGVKKLVLTNAAGAANAGYNVGDIMLIKDHINFAPNVLIGENLGELGERFPDVSTLYQNEWFTTIKTAADRLGVVVREGVYMCFTGPSYETAAEVKMAGILGADAVGMSTTSEALAAHHAGVSVAGISLITNMGTGLSKEGLFHCDVVEVGNRKAGEIARVICESIRMLL